MKKKAAHLLLVLGLSLALVPLGATVTRAASFPDHAITWIVPYSAGGGFDVWSRGVAAIMQKKLGVPVVIKNLPGAGGRAGLNFLYRSRPDGYTIGIANVPGHLIAEMVKKTEYNINKFTWLGRIARESEALAVAGDSRFKTVADLLHSKKPVRNAGTGPSSTASVEGVLAAHTLKFPMVFVFGYRGTSTLIPALLRGDADITIRAYTSMLPFFQSGQLRLLLAFTDKPPSRFPKAATVAELGHPGLAELAVQRVVAGPPGLPAARARILQNALLSTLKDPKFLAWAEKTHREHDVAPLNGKQTAKLLARLTKEFQSDKPEIARLFKNPTAVFK